MKFLSKDFKLFPVSHVSTPLTLIYTLPSWFSAHQRELIEHLKITCARNKFLTTLCVSNDPPYVAKILFKVTLPRNFVFLSDLGYSKADNTHQNLYMSKDWPLLKPGLFILNQQKELIYHEELSSSGMPWPSQAFKQSLQQQLTKAIDNQAAQLHADKLRAQQQSNTQRAKAMTDLFLLIAEEFCIHSLDELTVQSLAESIAQEFEDSLYYQNPRDLSDWLDTQLKLHYLRYIRFDVDAKRMSLFFDKLKLELFELLKPHLANNVDLPVPYPLQFAWPKPN